MLEAESSAAEKIISLENYNDTIGNRTRDIPTCIPNQLRHRVPLYF